MAWMSEEQAAIALGVPFRTIRRRVGNGSLRTRLQGSTLLVEVELGVPTGRPATGDEKPKHFTEPVPAPVPAAVNTPPRPPVEAPSLRPEAIAVVSVPAVATPRVSLSAGTMIPHVSGTFQPATPSFAPASAPAEGSRTGWLAPVGLIIGALVLAACVGSVWVMHEGRLRLHQVQADLAQTVASARQARLDHERQLSEQVATASSLQTRLTTELSESRDMIGKLTHELAQERQSAVRLQGELATSRAELAQVEDRRRQLARKYAVAQASATVSDAATAISESVGRLSEQFRETLRTAARTREVERKLALDLPAEPRERLLPAAAPTLNAEDRGIGLRRIIRE